MFFFFFFFLKAKLVDPCWGEGPRRVDVSFFIFIAFYFKCGGTPSLGMDPGYIGRVAAGG